MNYNIFINSLIYLLRRCILVDLMLSMKISSSTVNDSGTSNSSTSSGSSIELSLSINSTTS